MKFLSRCRRHSVPLSILAWACLLPTASQAVLLFYDGFDYAVGERLGDGSSSAVWDNPKDPFQIAAGSLTYSGRQDSTGPRVNADGTNPTLPYSYPMDDPANLESILQSGVGVGLLTWSKTNWLKTSY